MILAVDPGVTTGIALLWDDGSVCETYALRDLSEIDHWLKQIRLVAGVSSVAEKGPVNNGNYRFHIQQVEEVVEKHFPDTEWVTPSQWKGHPAARPDSSLSGKTQHEKDAVGLARWFKFTRSKSGSSPS